MNKAMVNFRVQVTATRGEQLVVEHQYQASPNQWVTVGKYLTNNINTLPTKVKRAPWMEQVPALFADCKVPRCIICDFPLASSVEEGCVPGNCSYRPVFGTAEYTRIANRRAQLERDAVDTIPRDEIPQLEDSVGVASGTRSEFLLKTDPTGQYRCPNDGQCPCPWCEGIHYGQTVCAYSPNRADVQTVPVVQHRETPAATWQRVTGQPWPGGTSSAVVALLKFFSIPCRPGSAEANVWLQQMMLHAASDFACPNCSGVKQGVCTHPWHWSQYKQAENYVVQAQAADMQAAAEITDPEKILPSVY